MPSVTTVPMEQMQQGAREQEQIRQGAEDVRLVLGNEEIARDQRKADQRVFPARTRLAVTFVVLIQG